MLQQLANHIDINFSFLKEKNKTEKVAYTIHRKIAIAIDDSSYNIPEVRAGPIT